MERVIERLRRDLTHLHESKKYHESEIKRLELALCGCRTDLRNTEETIRQTEAAIERLCPAEAVN